MNKNMKWNTYYIRSCLHENSERYGDGEYCVYFWQYRMGDVFYVGSGKGYRFNNATNKCRSREFMEYYNRGGCTPKIVWYGLDKEKSIELEYRLIQAFWDLGFPLVNKNGIKHREKEYREKAEATKRKNSAKYYMHTSDDCKTG